MTDPTTLSIARRFMRFESTLQAKVNYNFHSDIYGLTCLKWLHDNDPKGTGTLAKDRSHITFKMSDGSVVYLDVATGKYMIPA